MAEQSGLDMATGSSIAKMGVAESDANTGEIRYLGDMQRLMIGPEDIIVIKAFERLTETRAIGIKIFIENQFPGHRCLVLDSGMEIGLLSPLPEISDDMKVSDGTL